MGEKAQAAVVTGSGVPTEDFALLRGRLARMENLLKENAFSPADRDRILMATTQSLIGNLPIYYPKAISQKMSRVGHLSMKRRHIGPL